MRLKAAIIGDLEKVMAEEYALASKAVQSGVGKRTGILKTDLRGQVTRARLGGRLAKTWCGQVYENDGINAAGFVWSKAPKIVRAFDEGAVIRALTAAGWPFRPSMRPGAEPASVGAVP